jgi:hypothetical protein
VTVEEACLVVRGWKESGARLRVRLRVPSLAVVFAAFCKLSDARGGRMVFLLEGAEETGGLEVDIDDCRCEYAEAPEDDVSLPLVGKVESTIVALSVDLELVVMLLRD